MVLDRGPVLGSRGDLWGSPRETLGYLWEMPWVSWRFGGALEIAGEPWGAPGTSREPHEVPGSPRGPMKENRTGSLAFWGDKGRTLLKTNGF